MTSAADLYALLLTDERPSVASQVLTRPAGVSVEHGQVLVAVDRDGLRHLLVPVGTARVIEDYKSRGVSLGVRKLATSAGDHRYADLACTGARLSGTFEQLVQDVLARLQTSSENPLVTIAQALDDWRALLRSALDEVSREQIVGLVGELQVLSMLAERDPLAALDAWTGPSGATHDFAHVGKHLEVKATASVGAASVRISNLDQLDPEFTEGLWLSVVHVVASEMAPSIEERVDTLVKMGVPSDGLRARLGDAGFVLGANQGIQTRFDVKGTRWWPVGRSFPGLRASSLPPEVRSSIDRVEYDLILGALPAAMSPDEVDSFVNGWMG